MKIYIDEALNEQGESKGKIYIESATISSTIFYQVTLHTGTRKDPKLGEVPVYKVLADYKTVKGCCGYILNMKINESTAQTLSELRKDVERIKAYIERMITV